MNDILTAMMNPRKYVEDVVKNSPYAENPVVMNAIKMAENGDAKGVETLAKNLCGNMGIDMEQAIQNLTRMM